MDLLSYSVSVCTFSFKKKFFRFQLHGSVSWLVNSFPHTFQQSVLYCNIHCHLLLRLLIILLIDWHLSVHVWSDHKPIGCECGVSSEARQWTNSSHIADSAHYQLPACWSHVHSASHWLVNWLLQICCCNYFIGCFFCFNIIITITTFILEQPFSGSCVPCQCSRTSEDN